MTSTPLVSIVIPTYDRPELLGLALRTAVGQTYEHLDIYIADDGTNAETEAVVREVAGDDSRVRYERNETNLGPVGNGIKALSSARGEFMKMLLDDDLLMPTHVERLLAPMIEDASITLAFSKRAIIDEAGNVQSDPPGMGALAQAPGRISGEELTRLCCTTVMNWLGEQSTMLFPRRRIDVTRPFRYAGGAVPSGMIGDLAMWLSLLARGDAWYTPEPLSQFRMHAGQVSERADVALDSYSDWVTVQERLHLCATLPSREDRLTAMSRLIGVLAARIAQAPDLAAAARAQAALERATRSLGSLREHGRIEAAPRVSIVIEARGAAPALLTTLETIIATTPEDAFEVVLVMDEPSEATRALAASLEGDVRTVEVSADVDWRAAGRAAARHNIVHHLEDTSQLRRGWVADLFDELEQ